MNNKANYSFSETGIHKYVAEHIRALPDLSGKVVLDIPCGDGRASCEFKKKGAEVIALDLFPDFMKADDLKAEYADLSETLPIESGAIDCVICQEGIEHIPNQLNVLGEFNRVLKKGGVLLITTPNCSHVRARLSRFFLETNRLRKMPPTEIDSIWFAEDETDKIYFGHLFRLGVQHFQSLLTFAGFKVNKRIRTDIGNTSLIVGVALYPLFVLVSLFTYLCYRRKNPHVENEKKQAILWERVKLNLSPTTLFYKHIFWELRKEYNLDEVIAVLKHMQKK